MKDYSPGTFEIRTGTSDIAVIEEVISQRVYLKKFILPFIKRNGFIIDAGAHIGSFTIQSCVMLHPKNVLAIEPDRNNFSYLLKNITKAGFSNSVYPIQIALWHVAARETLYGQPSNPSSYSLLPSWRELMTKFELETSPDKAEAYSVQTDTVDNVLYSLHLGHEPIDLMKIDVEGAEEQVLKGSTNALRRCNVVVGELHETLLSEGRFRKMLKGFVVSIGEPFTSLRVRTFWAVKKKMLKTRAKHRKFLDAGRIADMEDVIWRLNRQLSVNQNQIETLNHALNQAIDNLAAQQNLTRSLVDNIHNSVSWKLTAPVRWLGSVSTSRNSSRRKLRHKS